MKRSYWGTCPACGARLTGERSIPKNTLQSMFLIRCKNADCRRVLRVKGQVIMGTWSVPVQMELTAFETQLRPRPRYRRSSPILATGELIVATHANIRKLWKSRGLSVGEFAARIGRSRQWVYKVEAGEGAYTLGDLQAIADQFGVQLVVVPRN